MVATPGNSLNITAAGLVKFDGTSAFSGVTTTQHDLLIGAASNGITSVAPSATSGVPVISQGASADPTFGTAVVAGGGTGITSATAYGVICAGTTSTGNFQPVTPGTSGFVLVSGGSGALPTWQANSGTGNLVLIQSQTASNSASLTFTTGITTTYNNYVLLISNFFPVTNATALDITFSTNGGSSYTATGYVCGGQFNTYNNTTFAFTGSLSTTAYIPLTSVNNSANGTTSSAWINFYDLTIGASGGYPKMLGYCMMSITSGSAVPCVEQFVGWNSTLSGGVINAIKLAMSSGNLSTGTFTLFGILE